MGFGAKNTTNDCQIEITPYGSGTENNNADGERLDRVRNVENDKKLRWSFWKSTSNYFNGRRGLYKGYIYSRPNRHFVEETFYGGRKLEDVGIDAKIEYRHRDFYGRVTWRPKDVQRYISPTDCAPKHLIVQATQEVYESHPAGDWRRTKITGNVPMILRISEWALAPSNQDGNGDHRARHLFRRFFGILSMSRRVFLVTIPLMIVISLPIEKIWVDTDFEKTYTDVPYSYWDYPKYTRNSADMQPLPGIQGTQSVSPRDKQETYSKARLLRPRQLVVLENGRWTITSETNCCKYIFFSWTASHFNAWVSENDGKQLEEIARAQTLKAGLEAYWLDFRCCAPDTNSELRAADLHRMCDVIRGARGIYVLLPDLTIESKRAWGSRMWTLPEVLLSVKPEVKFCSPFQETEELSKLDMAEQLWDGIANSRLLAEHYSNVLTLSRMELFSAALFALSHRPRNMFVKADFAYALMGLLHHRIQMDKQKGELHALAQLSLANDSDRLLERMVGLFPKPCQQHENIFLSLVETDQFKTHLWDIEPLCQVVGLDEGGEIILDGCQGISIRWKAFPKMKYRRHPGFRKFVAEITLRSGAYWSALGLTLMITRAYHISRNRDSTDRLGVLVDQGLMALGALALLFAFLLSLAAPKAVRWLYGGRIGETAPWLVGFEGVMPIAQLERMIFGNIAGRLTYEPSSTLYAERHRDERIGIEPFWVAESATPAASASSRPALPMGHRFFTLVDTGTFTVSIFSSVRPPSVALICGREGGMLRTVLCHYERSNNCLYKETVMRMDSLTLNQATNLPWIKFSLGNDMPSIMSEPRVGIF